MPTLVPPTPEVWIVSGQTACCLICGGLICRMGRFDWLHVMTGEVTCIDEDGRAFE